MALGTTASILLAIGATGAGFAVNSMMNNGGGKAYSPQALPKPPSAVASADKAVEVVKNRRAAMSQSVFTSPLGIGGQADVTKKTLLGT